MLFSVVDCLIIIMRCFLCVAVVGVRCLLPVGMVCLCVVVCCFGGAVVCWLSLAVCCVVCDGCWLLFVVVGLLLFLAHLCCSLLFLV